LCPARIRTESLAARGAGHKSQPLAVVSIGDSSSASPRCNRRSSWHRKAPTERMTARLVACFASKSLKSVTITKSVVFPAREALACANFDEPSRRRIGAAVRSLELCPSSRNLLIWTVSRMRGRTLVFFGHVHPGSGAAVRASARRVINSSSNRGKPRRASSKRRELMWTRSKVLGDRFATQ
jgi:hypothetical protein